MTADELRGLLRAKPFRPFVLVLAGGVRVEVSCPETVVVARTKATLGLPPHREPASPEELRRIQTIKLADIVRAEMLPE